MEISARGFLNEKSIRAVQGLVLFGKKEPARAFRRRMILYSVLTVFMLLFTFLLRDELFFLIACPICAALCLGGILLTNYAYRILPRKSQKKSPLAGAENLYIFREDSLSVSTRGIDGFSAEETRPYSMLIKMTECTEYLFLYLDKTHIYPIEKATLSETEIKEIRGRILAFPHIRYQACQY